MYSIHFWSQPFAHRALSPQFDGVHSSSFSTIFFSSFRIFFWLIFESCAFNTQIKTILLASIKRTHYTNLISIARSDCQRLHTDCIAHNHDDKCIDGQSNGFSLIFFFLTVFCSFLFSIWSCAFCALQPVSLASETVFHLVSPRRSVRMWWVIGSNRMAEKTFVNISPKLTCELIWLRLIWR